MFNGDMLHEIYKTEKHYPQNKFTLIIEINLNEIEQKKFWDYIKKYEIVNINDHVKEIIIKSG